MKDKVYICNDCPRECNAKRFDRYGEGFCKAGVLPRIARADKHMWEEPCISGENGSGAVFFGGCVMRCVFCQNYIISNEPKGKLYTIDELANTFKLLESKGVHNINLVTPTHYTNAIINALEKYKPAVPIVYNCSGYEKVETLKRFEGLIDVYLPDFKYFSDEVAIRYSKAKNYRGIALSAVKEMIRQVGKVKLSDNGIIEKGVIVRHLILPGHTNDSIKVLKLLNDNFADDILVSIMHQYYPAGNAKNYPEINRTLKASEYQRVIENLYDLDGYVQDEESNDKYYTPDFILE